MEQRPQRDIQPPRRLAVDLDSLIEFDQADSGRQLARLTADVELLTELALNGFEGPSYQRFADILARYGIGVLASWCRTGKIFGKCAEKGSGLTRRDIPADDAEELALETVACALVSYRKKILMGGRWDPRRGASIKTYFIGHCLLTFPNIYRAWLREEQRRPPVMAAPPDSALPGPEQTFHERLAVEEFYLGVGDPTLRRVLMDVAAGYSMEDIAYRCGLTVAAVKSRLYHYRKDRGVA